MGRIAGDGSDIVMVNGRQIRYQGIGHIRKDVSTAQAVERTAADGYKKYFLESTENKDRVVVYGDRLDFSFLARQTVPIVMVNGQPYKLVAQDEQDSSWLEGFLTGAKQGISQAGAATVEAAKQVISQIGVAGTLAVAGGTAFVLIKGVEAKAITGAIGALAIPALKIVGAIIALGIVVAGVAGGIKGAAEMGAKKHDTKAIAGIIDPAGEGNNTDPGGQVPGTAPETPTPAEPPASPPPAAPGLPGIPSGPGANGGEKEYHILPVGPQSKNAAARRLGSVLQDLEKRKN
ncbi:MAG: hypothetical protein FJZ01_11615 [Candidatus Sericytochromatia bacterium]|nr:hypothetical protein [Candidatus Tanganyikabacteria bacterium]